MYDQASKTGEGSPRAFMEETDIIKNKEIKFNKRKLLFM
jgi:hypothetical protein